MKSRAISQIRQRWLRWFIEPLSPIRQDEERRQAQLFTNFLFIILFGTLLSELTSPNWATKLIILVLTPLYLLCRTVYYKTAVTLALIGLSLSTLTFFDPDAVITAEEISSNVQWTLLPVLLASIIFSFRQTLLFAAGNFILILLLPLFVPGLSFNLVLAASGFPMTMFPLLLVVMRHRDKLEQERQMKLHLANLDLQESTASLQKSEARYRSLFEQSRDVIFITTRDGQIIDLNPAGRHLFGYTEAEISHIRAADLYASPEGRQLFREEIEKNGVVTDFEYQAKRKDGTLLNCLISATMWQREEDGLIGYQGIIRDITEQRQLEEQLRQAQKLQALGQMAGGIAHDFNNLLTVILMNNSLLLHLAPDLNDKNRKRLTTIKEVAERAIQLTSQLLAFSRGQMFELQILDLNKIIQESTTMIEHLVGRNITVTMTFSDGHGWIRADQGQIEQVILNLVVNASDAMPEGGKLSIETDTVYLDESYARHYLDLDAGHYVLLTVADTGVGMDKETQERLFEPFFTTKGRGKNTGLGLSTVHGIVKQSKGHIWVYSEINRGTTFKIYFPYVDEGGETQLVDQKKMADIQLEGDETILLVDDDEAIRESARDILTLHGYTVLSVSDEEALEVYQQNAASIHLLLTDVMMPHLSGQELVESILPLDAELKVLYMSGYASDVIVDEGRGRGKRPIGFLTKPFTARTLLRKVREVLDSQDLL